MTFNLNLSSLRKSTLAYLGLVIAGSLASQTLWVRNHIIPVIDRHPHLSFLGPALLTALTLLHNPQIAGIITSSLQQEETKTDEAGNTVKTTLDAKTVITPPAAPIDSAQQK